MMKIFPYSDLPGQDNFKFKVTRSILDVNSFAVHQHEFSELVIIFGGTAVHVTDNGEYPIAAGDVFVLNGDMAHGFEDCEGLNICNLMYNPEQMLNTLLDVHQIPGYQALFVVEPLYRSNHPAHNLLRLSPGKLEEIDRITWQIVNEFENKAAGYASVIQAYVMQIVVMLSRLHSTQLEMREETIGRLAQAITVIESRYQDNLKLEDLAKAAHLSKTHLLRLFKETFELSPMHYLIRLRIRKACVLLQETDDSITDVAHAVGFADSNYFSRQFRQIIGYSPRQYRKRYRR